MPFAERGVTHATGRITSRTVSAPGKETYFRRQPPPRFRNSPNAKITPTNSHWPGCGCFLDNIPRPPRLITARLLLTSAAHFRKYG